MVEVPTNASAMGYNYKDLLSRRHTRRQYLTPEDLLTAAAEYFDWCERHPLKEEDLFHYKGAVIRADKAKVRPFTKRGLCLHLGMPENRLDGYKARADEQWADAVELIEQVIHNQKFEHAAVGMMNPGFMVRDLGMADKQEVTASTVVQIVGKDADL